MEPYSISEDFRRLQKIAELEKRVSGEISEAKDSDGKIGLTSISSGADAIPESIKKVIIIRASSSVPHKILDSMIDDGHDMSLAHIAKRKIFMSPGEALYTAIGKKDSSIFDSIKNITLGEILSLVQNKAAVSATCAPSPRHIDDFDVPKHIAPLIVMRSMLPNVLHKQASNSSSLSSKIKDFKFQFSNGMETTQPKTFVRKNADSIQNLIDDGAIIKVVQILSSGNERTIFDKTASFDDYDIMYSVFLNNIQDR